MSTPGKRALAPLNRNDLNLDSLAALCEKLRQPTRAVNTAKGYAHDWHLFRVWCEHAARDPLPAASDTLALYVTWLLVEQGRRVSTAARHVSAIVHHHRVALHPRPATSDAWVVLDTVKRERREQPRRKAALSPEDLQRISAACSDRTACGLRDRALLVLGFASSLRRSELSRLDLADVTAAAQGLAIFVSHSKTDQMGEGRMLGVWRGRNELTDPVATLSSWLQLRGRWAGPLFVHVHKEDRVSRKRLSGEGVHDAIVRAIERAGMDATPYGAHSLRAGAITAAATAGRTDQEIMAMSGHKKVEVMRGYIRQTRLFSGRNPLEGLL